MKTLTSPTTQISCVKAATEVLGDKWTPQLLRWIHNNGSVRFCQLQDAVGGINPRTLSARLVSLEQHGIISKVSATESKRDSYTLTRKGNELLPILNDMAAWSDKYEAAEPA